MEPYDIAMRLIRGRNSSTSSPEFIEAYLKRELELDPYAFTNKQFRGILRGLGALATAYSGLGARMARTAKSFAALGEVMAR